MSARELEYAYLDVFEGDPGGLSKDDFRLVRDLVNACRLSSLKPLIQVSDSVVDLIGEKGFEDACAIAQAGEGGRLR